MEKFSQNSVMVSISKLAKRITLQRSLCSKLVYEIKNFRLTDLYCIYENQLWLETKCEKDKQFQKKFGEDLAILSKLLKEINLFSHNGSNASRRVSEAIRHQLTTFLFPRINYTHINKLYKGYFHLKNYVPSGIENKFLPPKTFIGIGYRDKGSARNVALDGSPSWQEVSVHEGRIYSIRGEKNEKNSNSEEPFVAKTIRRSNGQK